MKKVAVILSGCGVFDGAEIHESVLALYAIEKAGAAWYCFAPNIEQHHVINHLTGQESNETRNVLVEAARIARGNIQDLSEFNADEFDALLVSGGFGVAKNLTDFAFNAAQCSINTHVAQACRAFARSGKPAAYLCIAPVIIPLIYPDRPVATLGEESDAACTFRKMGGEHIRCPVDDFVYDQKHNVLSTPAYMNAENIMQAAAGIEPLVKKLIELA